MYVGQIKEIGAQAIDQEQHILLFFGKKVTEGLRPYAVIQEVPEKADIHLIVGDKILFGEQEYQITYLGKTVNDNLQSIEHISFVFSDVPADKLTSAVYLTPTKLPSINEGMTITYKG